MATIPRIGTEFAAFRIESLIGRGGMSVVYRAENPRLGTKVALKLLAPELSEDEAFRERFVRESRAAAAINHPNIVTIYDAGESDGVLYIAMRYVQGDLRGVLQREGALALPRVLGIVSQIAGGLDAAHAEGLVHRDVKPANVLVERSPAPGGRELVYLADFGLTKHGGSRGPSTTGQFLGTIAYMAPEQIEGNPVDARTDIYSLGCVVVECLTGHVPFPRETEAAALWAHMQEPPPRVSDRRPSVPAAVDTVVATALAKVPADRYESAERLALELSAAIGPVGSEMAPRGVTPRTQIATQRGAVPRRTRVRRRLADVGPPTILPLLLALAVGAGIGFAIASFGSSTRTETVARTTTRTITVQPPKPKFSPFDEALLASVPSSFRGSCRHVHPVATGFDASVACRPGPPVARLTYSHARSNVIMNGRFRDSLAAAGISLAPTDRVPISGTCRQNDRSVSEWLASGPTGHQQATEVILATTSQTVRDRLLQGHVLCFANGSRSVVEWTDDDSAIIATASGRDRGRLVTWWETAAGPR